MEEFNYHLQQHVSFNKYGRRRFLTKFHDSLSAKLQNQGLRCWLSNNNNHNWFTVNNLWSGRYACIEKTCKNTFQASICKYSPLKSVFIEVAPNELSIHSSFVKKIQTCRGSDRRSLGKELLAFGNTRVKVENVLFNIENSSINKEKIISENVLKQKKFEERHINRFSSDIIRDIEAVKLLTDVMSESFGYVQEISLDPFGYLTICEQQVKFEHKQFFWIVNDLVYLI